MRPRLTALVILLLTCLQGACPAAPPPPATPPDPAVSVYVVGHGWHTSLVIKRDAIPHGVWPAHDDFPQATYLEVAWGDQDFYQAPKATLRLLLQAAFASTASVLHVVAFSRPVTAYFPASDVFEVRLSQPGFRRLCSFIDAAYQRDAEGRPQPLGPGVYGRSQFYQATGTYHLFNTCNNWTAKALQAAGCPIAPAQAMTAENVLQQTSRFGSSVQVRSMPPQEPQTFCR